MRVTFDRGVGKNTYHLGLVFVCVLVDPQQRPGSHAERRNPDKEESPERK